MTKLTYYFFAAEAFLAKVGFEAFRTVWPLIAHYIALAAQCTTARTAHKVVCMPEEAFSLGALLAENNLIAIRTSRFELLGVMSAAIELAIIEEVQSVRNYRFRIQIRKKFVNNIFPTNLLRKP